MASFFKNFPIVPYLFGNESTLNIFQNITAYVSIIDEVSDDVSFYTTIFIDDFERPDTLSYRLYGTVDYYWTFYFLNPDIRESGWPVSESGLKAKAQADYPNQTIITREDISSTFAPGDRVEGLSSTTTGVVIKKYLDLGQIVVRTDGGNNFGGTETVQPIKPDGTVSTGDRIVLSGSTAQYLSVHHYENSSGEYQDIDPSTQAGLTASQIGLTTITYFDRVVEKNNALREIKVFTPGVVTQISDQYNRILKTGG